MTLPTTKQRNWLIELFRFVAAASIALYHLEWLYIGHPVYLAHCYIQVEFFFCLSGYFLAKAQTRRTCKTPVRYVFTEWKKLYPLYLLAFFVCFIVSGVQSGLFTGWTKAVEGLWSAKWEILLLRMGGLGNGSGVFNSGGAPDYISAMLLSSLVLCYLIQYHKKLFCHVAGPLLILAGYSHILSMAGNISQWGTYDGFLTLGFIRALAGMSAGALSYIWLHAAFTKQKLYTPPPNVISITDFDNAYPAGVVSLA